MLRGADSQTDGLTPEMILRLEYALFFFLLTHRMCIRPGTAAEIVEELQDL